jgi:predicted nucleic acid-binding protein
VIAADTNTWIAYLSGGKGDDVTLLDMALTDQVLRMIPVVLAELCSDPELPADVGRLLAEAPMVDLKPGYWQRAGLLRARVLKLGRKARLGDALTAQTAIDHGLRLITRDRDFQAFLLAAELNLDVY